MQATEKERDFDLARIRLLAAVETRLKWAKRALQGGRTQDALEEIQAALDRYTETRDQGVPA